VGEELGFNESGAEGSIALSKGATRSSRKPTDSRLLGAPKYFPGSKNQKVEAVLAPG